MKTDFFHFPLARIGGKKTKRDQCDKKNHATTLELTKFYNSKHTIHIFFINTGKLSNFTDRHTQMEIIFLHISSHNLINS